MGINPDWEHLADTDRKSAINKVFSYWLDKEMPVRYRHLNLMKLEPSDKNRLSLATQHWFYDEVRNNLNDGFMVFGPVGTGKTTVALGYYRVWLGQEIMRLSNKHEHGSGFIHAVSKPQHFAVWKQEAKTLLLQHHDHAINRPRVAEDGSDIGGAPKPLVTADKIRSLARNARVTPRLVLEEIDKVELTKARRDTLFDILNTLDAEYGKFFINTNLTPGEFEDMYGAEFVRRIKQSCRVIDLFANEKQ